MKKLMTLLFVVTLLCSFSTAAFARGGHYQYRDGRYSWWGLGGFLTGLTAGAVVASLPRGYETVVVGGSPYYFYDGYYYRTGPVGYVVVAPPVMAMPAMASPMVQGQPMAQGQTNAPSSNAMTYVLGTLLGVLFLAGIGLLLKKLLAK